MKWLTRVIAVLLSVLLLSCSDVVINDVETPEVWVDTFRQNPEVSGVDILWLIDRSGSMMAPDDTEAIARGISAMLNALPDEEYWRLSITSTDPEYTLDDDFFPLLPGDTIGDALDMLSSIHMSDGERGFDTLMRFINEMPGRYSGSDWMRRDAALMVVFVSDEEEQSNVSTGDFVDWLRFERPLVHYAAIVITNPGTCDAGYQAGGNYINAATLLNGTVVDFCDPDWGPAMSAASGNLTQPIDTFTLSRTPDPATITISVGMVPYQGRWEYIEESNAIHFIDVPLPGTYVAIAYSVD